jgi:hypothetical protein
MPQFCRFSILTGKPFLHIKYFDAYPFGAREFPQLNMKGAKQNQ